MTIASILPKKINGKWVGIIFQLLLVLHLLPFATLRGVFLTMSIDPAQVLFTGIWLVVAIFVLTAISGFVAEERILWETLIASCLISALSLVVYYFIIKPAHLIICWPIVVSRTRPPSWAIGLLVPALSLLGAWFGERIKTIGRTQGEVHNPGPRE
ncbi:hypothetical protein D4R75_03185 [bacterium]|nr:MAG: hypothetical protein D4R75_03185 [bacterium]